MTLIISITMAPVSLQTGQAMMLWLIAVHITYLLLYKLLVVTELTGSVTSKEDEGHPRLQLPFPLLICPTEHGAVSSAHGPVQLLDQVPDVYNTSTSARRQQSCFGHGEAKCTDLTQPRLAMTSAWLSLRTSPERMDEKSSVFHTAD